MGAQTLILIAWLAGLGFTAAMVWATWWALFADRSRGQRRCPRCWHVIDAGRGPCSTLRCGECGHWATRELDLLRTRRRWALAALSVVALLTGTVALRLRIAQDGWWTMVPDRALIAITPWLGDDPDAATARAWLRERLLLGRLSPESTAALLALLRDGDGSAPAGTDAWRRRYRIWFDALRNPEFWRRQREVPGVLEAAAGIPPMVTLPLPAKCRADTPIFTRTQVEDWLPDDLTLRLEVAGVEGLPLGPEWLQALLARRWTRRPSDGFVDGFALALGPLPAGEHAGVIRWRWSAVDAENRTIASGEAFSRIRFECVDRLPSPQPMSDAELDARVRDAFTPARMLRGAGAQPSFAFSYRTIALGTESLRKVAFGLVVEACEDGVPRRTLRLWWRGGRRELAGNEEPVEDAARLLTAEASPRWTLRVRSDADLARRAADLDTDDPATLFWEGAFELPLTVEDLPRGRAARAWRVDRVQSGDEPTPSAASTPPAR